MRPERSHLPIYARAVSARAHFRLAGVPVRIEPFFWLGALLLGLDLADAGLVAQWVAVVLVSLLVHEMGHALALRVFGAPASIVLHGFGGFTLSNRRLGRVRSIVVSLAGPLSALVLLGIPMALVRDSSLGRDLQFDYLFSNSSFGWWPIIWFLAYVNVWWSLANLLPIRPLDGGNVLAELIGTPRARLVSIVVAGAAAVAAWRLDDDFRYSSFLLGFLAFLNLSEHLRDRAGPAGPSVFDVAAPDATPSGSRPRTGSSPGGTAGRRVGPPTGRSDASQTGASDSFAVGVAAARHGDLGPLVAAYRRQRGGPTSLATARALEADGQAIAVGRALLASGMVDDAAASLQTHLHYAEAFASAAVLGTLRHPVSSARAQTAFDTACSWSRAGDLESAGSWLRQAIDDGFASAPLIDGEPDLAPLRADPRWAALRARLG